MKSYQIGIVSALLIGAAAFSYNKFFSEQSVAAGSGDRENAEAHCGLASVYVLNSLTPIKANLKPLGDDLKKFEELKNTPIIADGVDDTVRDLIKEFQSKPNFENDEALQLAFGEKIVEVLRPSPFFKECVAFGMERANRCASKFDEDTAEFDYCIEKQKKDFTALLEEITPFNVRMKEYYANAIGDEYNKQLTEERAAREAASE